MPIYAYKCEACGFAKDVLQKMSDPLLTVCPSCGAAAFTKQVTAAGFHLKGTGWYVTDFKDQPKKPAADNAAQTTAAAETSNSSGSGKETESAKAGSGSDSTSETSKTAQTNKPNVSGNTASAASASAAANTPTKPAASGTA